MVNYCNDVLDFQKKFGFEIPERFTFISQEFFDFRVKFFLEELREYEEAHVAGDLPGAIDALIDLVYITCGCILFHGISVTELEVLIDSDLIVPDSLLSTAVVEDVDPIERGPSLLSPITHQSMTRVFYSNLDRFVTGWQNRQGNEIKHGLGALYRNALYGSYLMGFTNDEWDTLWIDVQIANMSKERVLRAQDSKRGSTYDVRKPENWIPPRTKELVDQFLRHHQTTGIKT